MFLIWMSAAEEAGNFLKLSVYSGSRSHKASGSGKLEEEMVRIRCLVILSPTRQSFLVRLLISIVTGWAATQEGMLRK